MNCHFEILHIFEPVSFIGMRNIGRIWLTRCRRRHKARFYYGSIKESQFSRILNILKGSLKTSTSIRHFLHPECLRIMFPVDNLLILSKKQCSTDYVWARFHLRRVGQVKPPHLVLPLTVEPTKPRLCHDARFLNLWMQDKPFTLDKLTNLPRYVSKDTYQTVLDVKPGYDHLLLSDDSHTYFGFEWAGWYFTYNTLPFGWKISPYVYHTTGFMAANYFRSMSIPCLLYIDDRHNGQLQISLNQGEYASLKTTDDRNFAAGQSAIFLVAFYLVRLGYFLALLKSIFIPRKEVPYLGFGADSSREVFHILPGKKAKFLDLIRSTLKSRSTSVKTRAKGERAWKRQYIERPHP